MNSFTEPIPACLPSFPHSLPRQQSWLLLLLLLVVVVVVVVVALAH